MGKVLIDATMTMDGYWADAVGRSVFPIEEMHEAGLVAPLAERCGAVVMTRRSFDMAGDPDWYAAHYELQAPIFVVTDATPASHPRENARLSFTFVPSFPAALALARDAAGDRDVVVIGEAGAVAAALGSEAVDEIYLRVVTRISGSGTPLFAQGMPGDCFHTREIETTRSAVHLHLERLPEPA